MYTYIWGFPGGCMVKDPATNAGDLCSIPWSGRSPGGGHGNPLSISCLENPMDRGAWRATIYRVTESGTWLKWLSMHALTLTFVTCRVKHEASLTAHLIVRLSHSVFAAPRKWVLRGVSVCGVLLWNSCQQQEEVWVVVKPSKTWQFVGILFLPLIRIKLTLFKREGRPTPPPAPPRPANPLQKWYPNTISRRQ